MNPRKLLQALTVVLAPDAVPLLARVRHSRAPQGGPDPISRPRRGRLAVTALLVPFLVPSSPGLAQGSQTPTSPVTWRDQSRLVYASASAEGSPLDFDLASAPDLRPFQAQVGAGSGGGSAQAFQDSRVEQDGIIAKGEVDSIGFVFGDRNGQCSSLSSISLRFSVSTRASYQARGALEVFTLLPGGVSSSRVELLQEDGTPIFVHEASGPDGSVTIDQRGLLAPGEYVLRVDAGASAYGQVWYMGAAYDLALEVQAVGRAGR